MRIRLFFALCLFVAASMVEAQELARLSPMMLGGGGSSTPATCDATSEPAGDLFHDGFETATTGFELTVCGSAPCWTETSLSVPSNISGLSAPAASCNQGAESSASASLAYGWYNLNTTVTGYYGRLSLYIVSHGLTTGQSTIIARAGSNTSGANAAGSLQLYSSDGTALALRGVGATTATIALAIETWYVVDYCIVDGSDTSDFCGTGTNGQGWISLDDGSTKSAFTCSDVASGSQYFLYGSGTSSRTVDLHFGYVAADADGAW